MKEMTSETATTGIQHVDTAGGQNRFLVSVLSGDIYCVEVEAGSAEAARTLVEDDIGRDYDDFLLRAEFIEADTRIDVQAIGPCDNTFVADDDDIIRAPRDAQGIPRCPRCGGPVPNASHAGRFQGAISRLDDRTEICSLCGGEEAMLGLLRPPHASGGDDDE